MKNQVQNFPIVMLLGMLMLFSGMLTAQQPKLIVGIVVDQMKQSYLNEFEHHFESGGFARFMKEGYQFKNTHYNYTPTYTGPGHASIYTGATPMLHGIIANDWYNKKAHDFTYCASDSTVEGVGGKGRAGQMSPRNLRTTTISDELKLGTDKKGKVIGVSIKDRGAIFPAGHMADGAYWYNKKTGDFMSSTYYGNDLPDWMNAFNSKRLADAYIAKTWNLALDFSAYRSSEADNQPYERGLVPGKPAALPYKLKSAFKAGNNDYGVLAGTPYGNELLVDLAKAAIEGEQLGQDEFTDMLTVSFSATDYVGHAFGPRSLELEDTYIRLNQDLERLFTTLDELVGKGEYMVFLTADHGVADIKGFAKKNGLPAGHYFEGYIEQACEKELDKAFGESDWIASVSNEQVFLSDAAFEQTRSDKAEVRLHLAEFALALTGIVAAYPAEALRYQGPVNELESRLQRGYHHVMSGDVVLVFESGWMGTSKTGTTHGSGYTYDTHVPNLWYGQGISTGKSFRKVPITAIAPTLSLLVGYGLPSGALDEPLYELLED